MFALDNPLFQNNPYHSSGSVHKLIYTRTSEYDIVSSWKPTGWFLYESVVVL